MKNLHAEKLNRLCLEYEERMQLLKLNVADHESSERQKLQKLEKEIAIMREEFEAVPKKKPAKAKVMVTTEENEEEEYITDSSDGTDEEGEDDDDEDNDPEWKQTPLFRRIKKLRDENTARLFH